jgi:molecular chaperone GrpE (heat shock protein)
MKTTKYTPGPWRVFADAILTKDSTKIAEVCTQNENKANWEANARLIASAPELKKENEELKEALKNLLADIEHSKSEIPVGAIGERQLRAAKSAIQKATTIK